jgi:uncharacterized membrane protein YesL
MRIAYLNILWILFTVFGFLIAGIFPATTASFAIFRKWLQEEEFPVFKTFLKEFKQYFWMSQMNGSIMMAAFIILYFDILYFSANNSALFFFFRSFSILLAIVFFLTAIIFFPVFAHYRLSSLEYWKYSFALVFIRPFQLIFMMAGIVTLVFINVNIPSLIPFFGVSGMVAWTSWRSQKLFQKIDNMKDE